MAYRIEVRRTGFSVRRGGRLKADEVTLDPRNQLPILVGCIATHARAYRGVPAEILWQNHLFEHLESLDTFHKTVRRHIGRLDELAFGGRPSLLRIEYGAGNSRGTYRLVLAKDTELVLSDDLKALIEETATEKAAHWQLLPVHDRNQLRKFAEVIHIAAQLFDEGMVKGAKEKLSDSLDSLSEPRYRAVVLFRMARSLLRYGDEDGAESLIEEAASLVEKMHRPDPVLMARAQYNRAWLDYTRGDFSYQSILRAQRSLAHASPDDIRHGYIATLHGQLVVKHIERNYRDLSLESLTSKAYEALAYLTHAIYVLIRSEDFWAAQEACWNLADGLFSIGNIASITIQHVTGPIGRDSKEILAWINLSDSIGTLHATGKDSVRNLVLKASLAMTRSLDLAEANGFFVEAEQLIVTKERDTPPREVGRLYERRVDYYLQSADRDERKREEYERLAGEAYDRANAIWSSNPRLKSLVQNDLLARYGRAKDKIVRR